MDEHYFEIQGVTTGKKKFKEYRELEAELYHSHPDGADVIEHWYDGQTRLWRYYKHGNHMRFKQVKA